MKKIFTIFVCFFILIFITGCIQKIKIPLGVKPTKEFTIYDYIQDDAIFQASSELVLSGTSEEGVVIVATLYDNKGNNVFESYCTTNNEGIWELRLHTPAASMKNYSLKIKDSNEIYRKTINDIRFGETWLILGDNINNVEDKNIVKEELNNVLTDYNKMFYYKGEWIPASSDISDFGFNLINEIINIQKIWSQFPVGMVFATEEDTAIYEWLSLEAINSRKMIKDYLDNENIIINEDNKSRYSANVLNNKYSKQLTQMSYANIVLNQGIKDLFDYNNGIHYNYYNFENMYSMCLYTFISELITNVNVYNEIYFIQDSISEEDNIELLRKLQSNISKYYNSVNIIPTYDLCKLYDIKNDEIINDLDDINYDFIKIMGYDTKQLAKRIFIFDRNNLRAPCLDNVVQDYDKDENLISIKLIFENVNSFDNIEELIGLKFYDVNKEEIKLNYSIIENEILVDLTYYNNDEEFNDTNEEIKFYDITYVVYAFDNFILDNNLTSKGIPTLPFEVVIK